MKINQRAYSFHFVENLLNVLITVLTKQFYILKDIIKVVFKFIFYCSIYCS